MTTPQKLGSRLRQTAKSAGVTIVPITDMIKRDRQFVYHLSKPEVNAVAVSHGYYDIAEKAHPLYRPPRGKPKQSLKDIQKELDERLGENLKIIDMTPKQILEIASDEEVPPEATKGKSGIALATAVLSRGKTKEDYDSFVELAEAKKVENLASKWEDVEKFGKNLPKARKAYRKDLKKKGLDRDRVLASIIALMDESLMRIGSDASATGELSMTGKQTFGASTLSPENLDREKLRKEGVAEFDYLGKKQVVQSKRIEDEDVLKVLLDILDEVWGPGKPGCRGKGSKKKLFCYKEGNQIIPITDKDVREYLKKIAGTTHTHFFRFWHGTNLVKNAVENECTSYSDAVAQASKALGHMRTDPQTGEMIPDVGATAQKSYINPEVILKYGAGRAERIPVYCDVAEIIAEEAGIDTTEWNREDIVGYLKDNPKSEAWQRFLD